MMDMDKKCPLDEEGIITVPEASAPLIDVSNGEHFFCSDHDLKTVL